LKISDRTTFYFFVSAAVPPEDELAPDVPEDVSLPDFAGVSVAFAEASADLAGASADLPPSFAGASDFSPSLEDFLA
jgi:hypothetical protein